MRCRKLDHRDDCISVRVPFPVVLNGSLIRNVQATGKFVMHVEHLHLKSAANRLVVGLFISSLLIASAVLIAQNVPTAGLGRVGIWSGGLCGGRRLWLPYAVGQPRQAGLDPRQRLGLSSKSF